MVSLLTEMIAVSFMFAMVAHIQFVGVKMECFGMRQKSAALHKVVSHVLVEEKDGVLMKVIWKESVLTCVFDFVLHAETTTTTTVTVPVLTATNSQTNKSNYTCRPGATGFFADPSSCSIYHWCVLGILQSTHRCNAGLHFSSSSNSCLWPKDAECENEININRFSYLWSRRRTNCATVFANRMSTGYCRLLFRSLRLFGISLLWW